MVDGRHKEKYIKQNLKMVRKLKSKMNIQNYTQQDLTLANFMELPNP